MLFHSSADLKDDERERRPVWFDPDTLVVDTELLKTRVQENDRWSADNRNIIFVSAIAHEVDYANIFFSPTPTGTAPWTPGRKHWKIYPAQLGFYTDDVVIGYSGRHCGKSISLRHNITQKAIYFNDSNAIFTSFDKDHVEPLMNDVFFKLDEHPLLRLFVLYADGSRQRKHPNYQRMVNGFQIYGLSGGQTESASQKMESPHVNCFFGDEFQSYSKWAWQKAQNSINDFDTNRAYGSCFKVYGVNSKGRTDTTFYEFGHTISPYCNHKYTVASWDVPSYTLGAHHLNLETLDHSIEASLFKQQIRGLVGERASGVFSDEVYALSRRVWDSTDMSGSQYRYYRITSKIWASHGAGITGILGGWFRDPPNARQCVFSADYGTTSPTELGLWYEFDNPLGEGTVWNLMARLEIIGLDGAEQSKIFDYLMDTYMPTGFSIDSTGATDTVYRILTDANDVRYAGKGYRERIFPARMGSDTIIGYSEEKPPDGIRCKRVSVDGQSLWALMEHSNTFSTNSFVGMMKEGRIGLPPDIHLQKELLSLVERITPSGKVQYSGNDEHNISMMRCFALMYHRDYVLNESLDRAITSRDEDAPVGYFFSMDVPATRGMFKSGSSVGLDIF